MKSLIVCSNDASNLLCACDCWDQADGVYGAARDALAKTLYHRIIPIANGKLMYAQRSYYNEPLVLWEINH